MHKLLLALLLTQPLLAAEPVYKIAFRFFPAEGRSMHYHADQSFDDAMVVTDASGKEVDKKPFAAKEEVDYIETMTAIDRGIAVDFTRRYSKPDDKSYKGHTVHFVRMGGKVQATSNGVELKELQSLARGEENSDAEQFGAMLPKQPVAVGQTWKVEPLSLAKSLGFTDVDGAHSEASAKLVGVSDRNGHRIATVDVNFNLLVLSDKDGKLPKPAPFRATIRFDGAIDGSTWMHISVKGGFSAQQKITRKDGKEATVNHDFKFAVEMQTEDAR